MREQAISDLKRSRKRRALLAFMVFVGPALVLYTAFVTTPLLKGIYYSTYNWSILRGTFKFAGFGNYANLIKDRPFLNSLRFNFLFALVNVVFPNLFAFLLAVMVESTTRVRNIARSLFFMPNVVSALLIAFTWVFIFTGLYPEVVDRLGLDALKISWFGAFPTAFTAMGIVTVWASTGFLLILYIAGLQTIPDEMFESAEIDGATWLQKITNITIPFIFPTITICLFLSISSSFRVFELPFALTRGAPVRTTETLAFNIYLEGFAYWNNGAACAKGIVLLLIVAAITYLQVRLTSRREMTL
jgi:raffinose/stachyose/melibiose transport system permease protein